MMDRRTIGSVVGDAAPLEEKARCVSTSAVKREASRGPLGLPGIAAGQGGGTRRRDSPGVPQGAPSARKKTARPNEYIFPRREATATRAASSLEIWIYLLYSVVFLPPLSHGYSFVRLPGQLRIYPSFGIPPPCSSLLRRITRRVTAGET